MGQLEGEFGDGAAKLVFKRFLRPTPSHPNGREIEGMFEVFEVTRDIAFVVSSLSGATDEHGPQRFCSTAYPLATRPFISSKLLLDFIRRIADRNDWDAMSLDTQGYDRSTHRFRRDTKQQPVLDAFREMAEQGRKVHRMQVAFVDSDNVVRLRAAFDRYAQLNVMFGNFETCVHHFTMPSIQDASTQLASYNLKEAKRPIDQELLRFTFEGNPFVTYDEMRAVCDAIRRAPGMNLSIIHLNPYMQAQIVDFFTGAVLDMVILNENTITLSPQRTSGQSAMDRVATSIFRFYGEAVTDRTSVLEQERGDRG